MNEIGEILKEARIEKGYTLDDLQQITKIQKRYLEAIENGNTEILPGRFYARAFVKQYADIVGLNGEELLEEHLSMTSQEASEEFAGRVNVSPTRRKVKRSHFLNDINEHLPTILIFLLVAAILIGIYFAFRQVDSTDETETPIISEENTEQVASPQTDADEQAAAEEAAAIEEEEAKKAAEAEEEEAAQEIAIENTTGTTTTYEITGPHPEEQSVVLTATGGDSWVSIDVQGGASEAGLLADGQSLSVTFGADATQVDLVIGNATFTEVSLNDTEIQYSPESAGIVRQDLQLQFVE